MLDFGKYYFTPMLLEEDFHFGWMTLIKGFTLTKEELAQGYFLNDRAPLVKLNELKDYLDKHKRTIIYESEVQLMKKEYQDYVHSLNIKIASDNWINNKEEADKLFGKGYYNKHYKN